MIVSVTLLSVREEWRIGVNSTKFPNNRMVELNFREARINCCQIQLYGYKCMGNVYIVSGENKQNSSVPWNSSGLKSNAKNPIEILKSTCCTYCPEAFFLFHGLCALVYFRERGKYSSTFSTHLVLVYYNIKNLSRFINLLADPAYLEPADVRQQLSHYQLASRSQMSGSSPGGSTVVDNRPEGILTCEFCEFSSGYMQSLRRHYRDRHGGKKLFKCKDCSFFTCYK